MKVLLVDDERLAVEDSGQGFEEEILEKLRKGEPVVHNGMEHFGISNVKRRLNIIYGDAAEIHFSNEENRAKENKAKVEIELPTSKELNKGNFFAEQVEWNNIDKNEYDDTNRQLVVKGEEADESESKK